ncbi:MAG: hypothetical protein JXB62_04995 [Pirellulales bacterium]|nr:hypothetical protein [Pirellulales bacterium]
MRLILSLTAIGVLIANVAVAGDCTAPGCCEEACHACGAKKVCKVVCEMKKVTKYVWVVECEDFCAPLPNCDLGKRCCHGCGTGCCETEATCCGDADGCGSCCKPDPCEALRNRRYVPPKCGKVRTKKKLVKKEVTCEIPVYKCVVVCCDPGCCESGCCEAAGGGGGEVQEEEAPAPAPTAQTTDAAPLPPVLGTSYLQPLKAGR